MNLEEKQKFVAELIGNVEQSIMDKIGKVPESWDGIELRWFVRDHFNLVIFGGYTDKREKRYKDYENECLTNNLV